ncbi:hypothetical protein T492DRAFT_907313 [Pavlovales sp. CCMP2436]|nr:hypothetical protein T492DRAFT_907313 [Pavlovales sp. CCMP2436]
MPRAQGKEAELDLSVAQRRLQRILKQLADNAAPGRKDMAASFALVRPKGGSSKRGAGADDDSDELFAGALPSRASKPRAAAPAAGSLSLLALGARGQQADAARERAAQTARAKWAGGSGGAGGAASASSHSALPAAQRQWAVRAAPPAVPAPPSPTNLITTAAADERVRASRGARGPSTRSTGRAPTPPPRAPGRCSAGAVDADAGADTAAGSGLLAPEAAELSFAAKLCEPVVDRSNCPFPGTARYAFSKMAANSRAQAEEAQAPQPAALPPRCLHGRPARPRRSPARLPATPPLKWALARLYRFYHIHDLGPGICVGQCAPRSRPRSNSCGKRSGSQAGGGKWHRACMVRRHPPPPLRPLEIHRVQVRCHFYPRSPGLRAAGLLRHFKTDHRSRAV